MLKIRRPLGRLILNMGIAIPGKTVFLIETAPWMIFAWSFSVYHGVCRVPAIPQGNHYIRERVHLLAIRPPPRMYSAVFQRISLGKPGAVQCGYYTTKFYIRYFLLTLHSLTKLRYGCQLWVHSMTTLRFQSMIALCVQNIWNMHASYLFCHLIWITHLFLGPFLWSPRG